MDEEKAREILEEYLTEDNSLYYLHNYISWKSGESDIVLDGTFDSDELGAIAWWMKNKKEAQDVG